MTLFFAVCFLFLFFSRFGFESLSSKSYFVEHHVQALEHCCHPSPTKTNETQNLRKNQPQSLRKNNTYHNMYVVSWSLSTHCKYTYIPQKPWNSRWFFPPKRGAGCLLRFVVSMPLGSMCGAGLIRLMEILMWNPRTQSHSLQSGKSPSEKANCGKSHMW